MHTYKVNGKEVIVKREAISTSNEMLFKRIVELLQTYSETNEQQESSNLEKE
ncbi:MAG TPA: hypothetical protein PKV66_02475 [Candidatus Pelethenecus sp.]|nr:hypothetical protein [Candidatus Pelethenecus sp.]